MTVAAADDGAAAATPFVLGPEHEDFRASVRRFAQEKLAPGYLSRALSDEPMRAELRLLGGQGLLGLAVSEHAGGQAADHLAMGIACEEVARADFSAASLVFTTALNGPLIERFCPARADLLPGILSGELWPALALTETEAGSDAAAITTRAERVEGGWRLHGEKTSITSAQHADVAITFAKTDPGRGARGVSAMIVDLDRADPTISRQAFRDPGYRPVGRGAIAFDGTFVPARNLIGEENGGFRMIMGEFDFTRSLIGLMCIGIAETALDMTIAYAKERRTFGRPISANQGVSFVVAEHATYLEAARWLCYRALGLRDAGRPHGREAAMLKWWVPRLAFNAIQDCVVLHGHVGWSEEMPLQAMLRDVSALQIGDGTPQIQKLIIARELFGREFV